MAEENLTNPARIRKILAGKLFPMKALGYFAVVTGRGRQNDSIETIKNYEENFFRNSKLFKDGSILSSQVTTKNLSLAVAECFWKMVRETVEQEADLFKATRYNLETEWKNNYPRLRELDRDELFEKARGEILDEVVNLSQVSPKRWEEILIKRLWDKVKTHVIENVFMRSVESTDPAAYNTTIDIKLKTWVDQQLPINSVEVGWECLKKEFEYFVLQAPDYDSIFDKLKHAVIDETTKRHKWEEKAAKMLRIIQLNTLEDKVVSDKQEWNHAISFLETSVKEKLHDTEQIFRECLGPGFTERWLKWSYQTKEQKKHVWIKNELEKLLQCEKKHPFDLSSDEATMVMRNLQRNKIEVTTDEIQKVWTHVFKIYFLQQSLLRAYDCKKAYYLYHTGHGNEVGCNDVILFWRIFQVLKVTANALRQQIMNREARNLDKEIKEVLDDYNQDREIKKQLLTGRRVTLAEELKRVKQIQEKLEEFIEALNRDK